MCFPFAIPLMLMAGGAVAKYIGQTQAEHAQRDAANAERARQLDLSHQQDALVNHSIGAAGDTSGKGLTDATAQRGADIDQSLAGASPTQPFLPGSSTADTSIGKTGQRIVNNQQADTRNLAGASARMNGLGDALFRTNISVGRDSQGVNQIGASKMDSANVLPYELQAGAEKGGLLRGLGGLASVIGGSMLGAGAFGGGSGLANSFGQMAGRMTLPAGASGAIPAVL